MFLCEGVCWCEVCAGVRVCAGVSVCPGVRVCADVSVCPGVRVCASVRVGASVRVSPGLWVCPGEGVQVKCRPQVGTLLLIAPSELESPEGVFNSRHLSPEILFAKDENQDCR